MPRVPITAATLRHAMRDPRYWQQGHPERAGYVGQSGSRTSVNVRKQQAALNRARWLPGFRQWPFGFRLWRDHLDHCDLESGFISWDEA